MDPRAIDQRVRDRLADSLAHILERAGARMGVDPARGEAAIADVRSHPQDPGTFAAYFDVAYALFAEDLERARETCEELLVRTSEPCAFAVRRYDETLGADFERLPRLVFAEFSSTSPMVPPAAESYADAEAAISEALGLIATVDPSIRAELDALVLRLFVAGEAAGVRPFGGGTSLMAWGATFVNVDRRPDAWSMVQFLVHEVMHAVLMGRAVSDPLVMNPIHEEFPSPLRPDLRPMDGIYHATLVCGRLVAFNRAWLEQDSLTPEDRGRCEQAVAANGERYDLGVATIQRDGKLSEQGAALLQDSRALVAAAR